MFYLVSQKELSFSLGESEANRLDNIRFDYFGFAAPVAPKPTPKVKQVALATSYMSKEKEEKKKAVVNNAANNFHNIAFLLDQNLADRYNVTPELVRSKLKNCQNYVKKYAPIAKSEQARTGIPVSITLAQGLLESDAGASRLSKAATNHFGIKCFSKNCKKGHCKNFTDDTHKDFFVVYPNAWQSFRAHSLFLQQKRYASLFSFKKNDYKSWAKGLKSAGYATDKQYDTKLVKIIEALQLNKLD